MPKPGSIARGVKALIFCLSMSPLFSALAAVPPPRISDQTSLVEKKVGEESRREFIKREKPPAIEPPAAEKPEAKASSLRFLVNKIVLEGNNVIPTEALEQLSKPYENREQGMKELNELAQAIEQEYIKRGYITSIAYIPPQKVADGILKIRIVEGKTGELQVEGNRYFRTKRILSYVKIKKGKILRYDDIQKATMRLNQNPDREVRAVLKKGGAPETTDVILKVTDRFPLHAGFMNDNQGSDSSGKQRLGFTLRDSNLTGLDDTLYTGTIFGRHFGSIFTNYVFPIPQTDTKLSFNFSHSQVNPKKYLKPLGVNGISQNYTGQIEQRVLWKENMTLDLFSSLEFKESRTKILSGTYYRERLRILHAGASAHVEDLWGATDIEAQGSFGINGLGAAIHADPSNGRQGVDPAFFVLTGNFSRLQRLPYGMMLNAKGNAQFPTEKLTSSEALYLGGANSVRGYPEGDYLADCGYYTNVELMVPSFFIPEDWHLPFVNQTLRNQIQLVAFWDEGYGRLRGPSGSEAANRFLMGAGGGLRIHLFRNIYARTEWACGIGDFPLTDSNRYQFHFRIQAEI